MGRMGRPGLALWKETARAIGTGLLLAAVFTACSEESGPTAPARQSASAQPDEPTPSDRMSVIRPSRDARHTPTPTAAGHTTPGTPTKTRTPTITPTPTPTPTVTPTPTPAFPIITLRAVDWQWDFYGPDAAAGLPYPGLNTITIHKGVTYELHIYNGGPPPDAGVASHVFSGIPALSLSAATLVSIADGGTEIVQRFTANATGRFIFNCADTNCSIGDIARQHDQMYGTFLVVP